MVLMLAIAVPIGLVIPVALELLVNRRDGVESWIEDAHPLFARPASDVHATPIRAAKARAGQAGERRAVRSSSRATRSHRRQVLRLQ